MTPRTEATALFAMYLLSGAEAARKRGDMWSLDEFGGHIGLANTLVPYAGILTDLMWLRINDENTDWPGVFEYEVVDPLGGWLLEKLSSHDQPTEDAIVRHFINQINAFFAQGSK